MRQVYVPSGKISWILLENPPFILLDVFFAIWWPPIAGWFIYIYILENPTKIGMIFGGTPIFDKTSMDFLLVDWHSPEAVNHPSPESETTPRLGGKVHSPCREAELCGHIADTRRYGSLDTPIFVERCWPCHVTGIWNVLPGNDTVCIFDDPW